MRLLTVTLTALLSTTALTSARAACTGVPVTPPPTGSLIMPPVVPQPSGPNDLVGVNVQQEGDPAALAVTFGQVFKQGALLPSDNMAATGIGRIQRDALALWPDGSVKLAAITLPVGVCAGNQQATLLTKTTLADPRPAVVLTAPALTVQFTGGVVATVDLGAALAASLAGTPDYWLRGPEVTQARVDVPVPSQPEMHVIADVSKTWYGTYYADVQVNRDLTTIIPAVSYANPGPLPPLAYTAVITLNGVVKTVPIAAHYQYQDWHTVIGAAPNVNVQHDAAYLAATKAVLKYDPATGVRDGGQAFVSISDVLALADFGKPLAANGVTKYMPTTGDRPDIGFTTQPATVWLLTGDPRSWAVVAAQGDTAGAVPWNWKLTSTHQWITPVDSTKIWVDGRSNTTTLANHPDVTNSGWQYDPAHQPNLAYVPYIATASRWYLDRLNAEAAQSLTVTWPDSSARCGNAACDIVMQGNQVRGTAWSLREIGEAGFIGKMGSPEQVYFTTAAADNWTFFLAHEPDSGEATGWFENYVGDGITPWQQDYVTGIAGLLTGMGYSGAGAFLQWQHPWLTGRFIASDFNPHDGCAYELIGSSGGTRFTTWTQIESATTVAGLSNGTGWTQSAGDYCQLARAGLGAALAVTPGDVQLTQALAWLNASGAPFIAQSDFQQDPTWNVVP